MQDADKQIEVDADEMTRVLRARFASPDYRPPLLPHVAMELMQLSQRPNVQFEQLVKVLEQDPVLAARTLSIAQSAMYAARSPILSLYQATVRLGMKTLRDLVLEAALHVKIFRAPGFEQPMARLARHSTATAHVVRAVCNRTRLDAEYAFLCGLLHDVGIAGILLTVSEDPRWRNVTFEQLAPILHEIHVEASATLTRLWKLPDPLLRVVATHHQLEVHGEAQKVNAALIVAEQLAWEAGAGMMPPPEKADPMTMKTPEPPTDGLDVNWTGLVNDATRVLGLDPLGFCATRAEAFELIGKLGLAGSEAKPVPAPARAAQRAPQVSRR